MDTSRFESFVRDEADDVLRLIIGTGPTESFNDLHRTNLCDPVSNELALRLEEYGYTVESPIRAPVNGAKHFIALVTASPTEDLHTPLVLDVTIRQFGEDYPTLVVERLDSTVVDEYYDRIEWSA